MKNPKNNLKSKVKKKPTIKKQRPSQKPQKETNNRAIFINPRTSSYEFDRDAYHYFYAEYPPTRGPLPPQNIFFYPSTSFPYPGTFSWTGIPNFPNDPLYPEYLFPPQPPMTFKHWPFNDQNIIWPSNGYPEKWPKCRIPKIALRKIGPLGSQETEL